MAIQRIEHVGGELSRLLENRRDGVRASHPRSQAARATSLEARELGHDELHVGERCTHIGCDRLSSRSQCAVARSGRPTRPATLRSSRADHLLVELAHAGLGNGIDKVDLVGDRVPQRSLPRSTMFARRGGGSPPPSE